MSKEITMTMKDFNLGNDLGTLNNKEDRRVYIEKANAKASLTIKACKKAKKSTPNNREVEDYIDKVRLAISSDSIPLDVTIAVFDKRIETMKSRRDKLLRLKDRQRGFLAKSDARKLEQWIEAIKQIEFEKEDFLEQNKAKKQEKFDVVKKKDTKELIAN